VAQYAIQKLKIEDDHFSFGTSYLFNMLGMVICICVFGIACLYTEGLFHWMFLGAVLIAAVAGLPVYLIGAVRKKWLPSWGANTEGIITRHRQSLKTQHVKWDNVVEISLIESFLPKAKRGTSNTYQKKAVLITLKDAPEPLSWDERLDRMVPNQYGLPPRVLFKNYAGSTQKETEQLIRKYAPVSIVINKIGKQIGGQIIPNLGMDPTQ
jgi:hypothetical protein